MGTQIKVFRKNFIDIDSPNVTITASDDVASDSGNGFTDQLRDRRNSTGWATTGSDDTATTTLDVNWIDSLTVQSIILIGHNFKDYNIQRWNGSNFEDFDTPLSVTDSESFVTEHEVPSQSISRIRITISASQVADADKRLRQLIVTDKIESGQFRGWPEIKKLERSFSKRSTQSLSGRFFIREQVGHSELELNFKLAPYDEDLKILEAMFFANQQGFLIWPSGGDETQFKYARVGYRAEDIFLMKCSNEWNPVFQNGIYKNGVNVSAKLVEVI